MASVVLEDEITLPVDFVSDDASVQMLAEEIIPFEARAGALKYMLWLCAQPNTPENVLLELSRYPECVAVLSHRAGPRSLIKELAQRYHYPEASITLGLELYSDPASSDNDFVEFLRASPQDVWLFETLLRATASSATKHAALCDAVDKLPANESLLKRRNLEEAKRQAIAADSPPRIRELFATQAPEVWRALAQNPATPADVLEYLSAVSKVPLSREIRRLAVATLRLRNR